MARPNRGACGSEPRRGHRREKRWSPRGTFSKLRLPILSGRLRVRCKPSTPGATGSSLPVRVAVGHSDQLDVNNKRNSHWRMKPPVAPGALSLQRLEKGEQVAKFLRGHLLGQLVGHYRFLLRHAAHDVDCFQLGELAVGIANDRLPFILVNDHS